MFQIARATASKLNFGVEATNNNNQLNNRDAEEFAEDTKQSFQDAINSGQSRCLSNAFSYYIPSYYLRDIVYEEIEEEDAV